MSDPLGMELDLAVKGALLFKVKSLLARGADPNFRNEYGATPLIEASLRGYQAIVRVLLEYSADVNAVETVSGSTALSLAALTGQAEVIELLLKWGAAIDAKDFEGRTALFEAALSGHYRVAAILLERGADIHIEDVGGRTALTEAYVWGEAEVAELLIRNGAYENTAAKEMLRENWGPDTARLIDASKVPSKLFQSH